LNLITETGCVLVSVYLTSVSFPSFTLVLERQDNQGTSSFCHPQGCRREAGLRFRKVGFFMVQRLLLKVCSSNHGDNQHLNRRSNSQQQKPPYLNHTHTNTMQFNNRITSREWKGQMCARRVGERGRRRDHHSSHFPTPIQNGEEPIGPLYH